MADKKPKYHFEGKRKNPKGKDVYVLEVNTIPGLTPVSLFPKSAASIGISYSKLLDKIVMFALQK